MRYATGENVAIVAFYFVFCVFTIFRLNDWRVKGLCSTRNILVFLAVVVFATLSVIVRTD